MHQRHLRATIIGKDAFGASLTHPIGSALLLVAALMCLVSCQTDPTMGYASASMFPENVTTIAIPFPQNDSTSRRIPHELMAALVNEIETRTPYRVVPESRADSILDIRIRRVELDQLSKSRETGLAEEMAIGVTLDFEWRNLRSGRSLLKRDSFTQHGLFIPSGPTGEPIEVGEFATVQQLARDLVDEMRTTW